MSKQDILLNNTGTGLKDFLSALLKPIQTLTDGLKTFEINELKRAKFNGQKIVLQEALNDIFGIAIAPFIYIETVQSTGKNLFLYEQSEASPVFFSEVSESDPVYIFESGEVSTIDYDFKVKIPVAIYTAELDRQVKAQTKIYKVAGKRFITETY